MSPPTEPLLFLSVNHSELEHSLSISASQKNPVVAGTTLTLTCTAVSSRPAQLNWLNSDGATVNSTSFIAVSQVVSVVDGFTTTSTLTFYPLKTSHADTYTCSCVIAYPRSDATTTHQVIVQGKVLHTEKTLCSLYSPSFLYGLRT